MKPETEKKEDDQYQLIDLDELEFQPIKIKYRGKEYVIDKYTCEDHQKIDEMEKSAMENPGLFEKLLEIMSEITKISLSELKKMSFSTYQQMRMRLFMGISLGKKKEPKKSS